MKIISRISFGIVTLFTIIVVLFLLRPLPVAASAPYSIPGLPWKAGTSMIFFPLLNYLKYI